MVLGAQSPCDLISVSGLPCASLLGLPCASLPDSSFQYNHFSFVSLVLVLGANRAVNSAYSYNSPASTYLPSSGHKDPITTVLLIIPHDTFLIVTVIELIVAGSMNDPKVRSPTHDPLPTSLTTVKNADLYGQQVGDTRCRQAQSPNMNNSEETCNHVRQLPRNKSPAIMWDQLRDSMNHENI